MNKKPGGADSTTPRTDTEQADLIIDEYDPQNARRNTQRDFAEDKRGNIPPAPKAAQIAAQKLTEATDHTAYCKEYRDHRRQFLIYRQEG